jgi:metal-sulfur cluster biosynthetic enzyme
MVTEEQVMEALKTVNDPELMLPLVDLGLIYGIDVEGDDVAITMTLTTPACPMNQYIGSQVEEALREHVPQVKNVGVNIVWSPPWNPEMMSEDAKMELGFF